MENITNMTTPSVHNYSYYDYYNDSYYYEDDYNYSYHYEDDNNHSYYYEDVYYDHLYNSMNITSLVIFILVLLFGVLGNGVVIWATGFRMKKTVSTVWYLNLAVADFLATAFLPLKITDRALNNRWPFGEFMCKMDTMVFQMNMYASIFTLVAISVDRCVGVVCPLWARCSGYRTVRKAFCVSLAVWVVALALSIPEFIFRETFSLSEDEILCYEDLYIMYQPRLKALVITNFVVGFVVPFTVIVSCYSVIIYRLRNNRPFASQSGRSFNIIAAVIAAFFLCWVPFHIMRLIRAVFFEMLEYSAIEYIIPFHSETMDLVLVFGIPISHALALLNSCLNPLLYVFSQGFKDVFRSRSIVKVLEKAFAEEPPQTENTPTDPDLSEIEGTTGPSGTQDPPGDSPV